MDPSAVKKAITPRTKAIMPVHLYDGYADMDAILDLARKHNLRVIEDCAHKHGGEWDGVKAGNMGDIGSFSFQLSKLMTAGEGGALTTSDPELYEKLDALRNCGRRPEPPAESTDQGAGFYGDEGNFIQSGNYRQTDFQAGILLAQLERLPEQNRIREANIHYLNAALADLPGVAPMAHSPKEKMGACFNYSFRYNTAKFKFLPVQRFREAMKAELGFELDACYEPLNACALYAPHTKPSRYRLSEQHWRAVDPKRFDLPVCHQVFQESSVCVHHAVLLGSQDDMDQIIRAIQKILDHASELQ